MDALTELGHHVLDYRARLSPVKALAALDPLTRAGGLDRASVEPGTAIT